MKIEDVVGNPILVTDSYKASHFLQYPADTKALYAYLEARKGARYSHTLFFGLRYILQRYFDFRDVAISTDDVKVAAEFWKAHGEPFNEAGWMRVVDLHGGRLPLTIRAPKEGTLVPIDMPLITVESEDSELWWLVTHIEMALMRIWAPATIATRSFFCKQVILKHLRKSANNPDAEIAFKLHDFGGRGVSSGESAGIGASAHLVNFMGTDTVEGIIEANLSYPDDDNFVMHGFSIPAMEHSTVISWGKKLSPGGEIGAFRNMLRNCKERGFKIVACVSDSYDLFHCVENIWCGELLQEVQQSGMKVVIRPDSGDPVEVNREILRIMARKLGSEMKVNQKGYVTLPDYFSIIQGDGNDDETSIDRVLTGIEDAGFSASNIAFGMGGGLLQKLDRDTQRFAYKISAIQRAACGDEWLETRKIPKTDKSKASKGGRVQLLRVYDRVRGRRSDDFVTANIDQLEPTPAGQLYDPESEHYVVPEMEVVFKDGCIVREQSFSEIRQLAAKQVLPEVVS